MSLRDALARAPGGAPGLWRRGVRGWGGL